VIDQSLVCFALLLLGLGAFAVLGLGLGVTMMRMSEWLWP
jgi:hypothetical protein